MALWTWWPGDTLPTLTDIPGFGVRFDTGEADLVALTGLDAGEVRARLGAGNRCYVAYLDGVPVSYGWVARADASIGELQVDFRLAGANRYLWDFVTLPERRGRGLYPRLLQSILRSEGTADHRFWVINAPENTASESGIRKAGFREAGNLAFARDGRAGMAPIGGKERAGAGAALLGVELVEANPGSDVSPCWMCVMDSREAGEAACWPKEAVSTLPCVCGRS